MKLFQNNRLALISGPCVIESRDLVLEVAQRVKEIAAEREIDFVFKASFDKANRSSVESFRGPGLEKGLAILADVKREVGVPVNTDIHEPGHAEPAGRVVDFIQIPAFLSRQTDLLLAAARTGKPLFVKKAQFMAPEDMSNVVGKIESVAGHGPIALMERGTSFGYRNLVVDMRSLPIMRAMAPVIFDGTHSVQRPGGLGKTSGGDRDMIPYLVRAATAAGIDGLFLETHPDPAKGLSDGTNMLPLDELPALLDDVLKIRAALRFA